MRTWKEIVIMEGYIVVNKDGWIYTGRSRNGKEGFSENPKVFKVYSTEGGARCSSPYQEAKCKNKESELKIKRITWSSLDINN